MPRTAGKKVGVERKNHVRAVDPEDRLDRLSERGRGAGPYAVSVVGFPLVPARPRKVAKQSEKLSSERRRADCFGQDAQSIAFLRSRLLQSDANRGKERRPCPDLVEKGDALGPVWIVKVVERRLAEGIGRAEARRMERIAFRFRRTAHVA